MLIWSLQFEFVLKSTSVLTQLLSFDSTIQFWQQEMLSFSMLSLPKITQFCQQMYRLSFKSNWKKSCHCKIFSVLWKLQSTQTKWFLGTKPRSLKSSTSRLWLYALWRIGCQGFILSSFSRCVGFTHPCLGKPSRTMLICEKFRTLFFITVRFSTKNLPLYTVQQKITKF